MLLQQQQPVANIERQPLSVCMVGVSQLVAECDYHERLGELLELNASTVPDRHQYRFTAP